MSGRNLKGCAGSGCISVGGGASIVLFPGGLAASQTRKRNECRSVVASSCLTTHVCMMCCICMALLVRAACVHV